METMKNKNVIFTDIDGVLNTIHRNEWNKNSIDLYNKLVSEFNLEAVITSTWRLNHTIEQMRTIFMERGVCVKIVDFCPVFPQGGKGAEIKDWLNSNGVGKFIILDDNVRDIINCGLPNVIKCRSWIGFSEEDYVFAKKLLTQ
jgi:hypothetical protein